MNKLTKQWFDDANRDVKDNPRLEETKVFFKKSSNVPNGKANSDKFNFNNSANSNKILLESTSEDEEDEDVVIDKITLIKESQIPKK